MYEQSVPIVRIEAERDKQQRLASEYGVKARDRALPDRDQRVAAHWQAAHEYAAKVLQDLIEPPVMTYHTTPAGQEHTHPAADGADGRDAHAS